VKGGRRRGGAVARSLHHCKVARGYNARVRAVEGPVTAGYERPTSQFENNNEKRVETKKRDAEKKREEDISLLCDKSRDMTFSSRDKSYRIRGTFTRRKDLLGKCTESTRREFSVSFHAKVMTCQLISYVI